MAYTGAVLIRLVCAMAAISERFGSAYKLDCLPSGRYMRTGLHQPEKEGTGESAIAVLR
jgi:hypothetical protein